MPKRINRYSFILILSALTILSSCNSKVIYSDSKIITENRWNLFDTPLFEVPVNDTTSANNLFLTIRTGTSYPFRNIFLFVTTTSPNGQSLTDTLEYLLADEKGKWYGKGFGDIHELKLPYRTNVYFPVKGAYQVRIQHGMRIEDLKGVYDIGLRIEKMEK